MLKDRERYILTTARASVIRSVLSLLVAKTKSQVGVAPVTDPNLDALARDGCDRMILELRRPKETTLGGTAAVRNLRTSRLGRVLVVTGDATTPAILSEIEALRRPHFSPQHITSGLHTFVHALSSTLRLAHPQS